MPLNRIGPNNGLLSRVSPSGLFVELLGSLVGNDSLIPGNTVTDALDMLASGGMSAWDVVVESLADLPTPVGGFIDLVDGSYAFKSGVSLGANTLRVAAGVSVMVKGMGGVGEKLVTGSGAQGALRVLGSARIETINLQASGPGGALVVDGGSVESTSCQFSGATAAVVVSGRWRDTGGIVGSSIASTVILNNGADVELSQTRVTAGVQSAVELGGASRLKVSASLLQASAAPVVLLDSADAHAIVAGSELVTQQADGVCVQVDLCGTLQLIGGAMRGLTASPGTGLLVDGDIDSIQLVGVRGSDLADGGSEGFVRYASGTVGQATVQGCSTDDSVATAIDWPSASIPTNGLLLVGNSWDAVTPYSGFTHTDARVNCKANSFQSGLMAETPIVP